MFRRWVVGALNALLIRRGLEIVRQTDLDRWVGVRASGPSRGNDLLPPGAAADLRWDHPRLVELRDSYRGTHHPATRHSQWKSGYVEREIDLRYFRADNAYLWQLRDSNTELSHVLTTYYVQRDDPFGLLDRLGEDGLFGAHVFRFNDRLTVSRDLLDSIVEIWFLERHLGVSRRPGLSVLDIGAGYGRLAHRMTSALPQMGTYFCVDAIPESTFLSEYYLRFRGVGARAVVVPLPELEDTMTRHSIDLAVNVHCFSECTLDAIEWWVDFLRRHRVPHLMVVPNAESHGGAKLLSTEADRSRRDFLPSIISQGYALVTQEPKYLDASVQRLGVSPTYYFLFRLNN